MCLLCGGVVEFAFFCFIIKIKKKWFPKKLLEKLQ